MQHLRDRKGILVGRSGGDLLEAQSTVVVNCMPVSARFIKYFQMCYFKFKLIFLRGSRNFIDISLFLPAAMQVKLLQAILPVVSPTPVAHSVAFTLPKTDCWEDLDRIPLREGG